MAKKRIAGRPRATVTQIKKMEKDHGDILRGIRRQLDDILTDEQPDAGHPLETLGEAVKAIDTALARLKVTTRS